MDPWCEIGGWFGTAQSTWSRRFFLLRFVLVDSWVIPHIHHDTRPNHAKGSLPVTTIRIRPTSRSDGASIGGDPKPRVEAGEDTNASKRPSAGHPRKARPLHIGKRRKTTPSVPGKRWKPSIILVRSKPTTLQNIHRDTSINHTDETGLRTTRTRAKTARKRRQRSARRAGRSNIRNSITRTEPSAPARSPDLQKKENCIVECRVEGGHRESERYNPR